ncbi:MAG TPA: 50S ribosomal protein L23 [Candidatus Baltobacteraceae bacterium]|nr:50S ribosomal protein L23 [Candidatus Baltobacteraceae bacterium]
MTVLMHPLSTEKSVGFVDKHNVITYMVDYRATKTEISKEFESRFNVKVERIRTINMPNNKKKAFIKLAKGFAASDVAVKLKLV